MIFNLFNKKEKIYNGVVKEFNNSKYLILEKSLFKKIKRFSKKYTSYDMLLTNSNEITLIVGLNNPFKFNKRSKINMIFIPTKISYYLQHYNIKIKLIKEKQ